MAAYLVLVKKRLLLLCFGLSVLLRRHGAAPPTVRRAGERQLCQGTAVTATADVKGNGAVGLAGGEKRRAWQ